MQIQTTQETKPILYLAFPMSASRYADLEQGLGAPKCRAPDHTGKPRDHRHLTISYLDEVRAAYVPTIIEGVEHFLTWMPRPAEFLFRTYRLFPTPRRTYLVACAEASSPTGNPEAWSVFIRRLRTGLRSMLAPKMDEVVAPNVDDRAWNPHVTMGAVHHPDHVDLTWSSPTPEVTWRPNDLALYQKDNRGQSGRILKRFSL